MSVLPNVFLVGAPKCGTTALATWLAAHPEVYFSATKEPGHFYSPYGRTMPEDEYLRLFQGVEAHHRVVAEGSVWYLFSGDALSRIKRDVPGAKIIVCIRNPAEMAFSLHQQKVLVGHEREKSFARAWALNGARRAGAFVSIAGIPEGDPRHMDYFGACRLGSQLARLRHLFGEAVHVVVLDDVRTDPRTVWLGVQRFLELSDDGRTSFGVVNPAKRVDRPWLAQTLALLSLTRSKLGIRRPTNLLAKVYERNLRQEKSLILPSEHQMLTRAFADEVAFLQKQLGRRFRSWAAQ